MLGPQASSPAPIKAMIGPAGRRGRLRSQYKHMRTVNATRYVTPLREGGSLPAIIEADDDGMYVLKFRGAGQGTKALIAVPLRLCQGPL